MSDTGRAVAEEKLAQCAEALADLDRYRADATLASLRENPDTYYAVCYRFLILIESLFDLGQLALAAAGARAESQRDIPALLARNDLITAPLGERIAAMYGFRNRLVHAYGTLDDAKVADYLVNRLDDARELLAALRQTLAKE